MAFDQAYIRAHRRGGQPCSHRAGDCIHAGVFRCPALGRQPRRHPAGIPRCGWGNPNPTGQCEPISATRSGRQPGYEHRTHHNNSRRGGDDQTRAHRDACWFVWPGIDRGQRHAECFAHRQRHADTDRNPNAHRHGNPDPNPDGHANPNPDGHANPTPDSHRHANPTSNPDRHADPAADAECDRYPFAVTVAVLATAATFCDRLGW